MRHSLPSAAGRRSMRSKRAGNEDVEGVAKLRLVFLMGRRSIQNGATCYFLSSP